VLKKLNDQDIASGDIESGSIVSVVYDGTSFQMTSQLASTTTTSPGGSNTQVQYNSSSSFAGSANFTFDGTSATVGGPFILPDGAVGAPALTNTGDLDSGIYFPGANEVGVATAGALALKCDAAGIVTKPLQPCFRARPSDGSTQANMAIDTTVTIVFGTEGFDIGSNFASNTFTAPVTAKYQLNLFITLGSGDKDASAYQIGINTSNHHYYEYFHPGVWDADGTFCMSLSILADMDASDTALISFYQTGGTAQTDVVVASTWFSGCLLT
jgi:hypothetical protein